MGACRGCAWLRAQRRLPLCAAGPGAGRRASCQCVCACRYHDAVGTNGKSSPCELWKKMNRLRVRLVGYYLSEACE